jgi:acyl-CoA thioesterase-1
MKKRQPIESIHPRLRLVITLVLVLIALAPSASATDSKNIVLLGDSIGAGYGLDGEPAFATLLQQRLDAENPGWKMVNASVSGDTTAGGLRRIGWVLKRPAAVLIIELGGNDGLRGVRPEETRRNLEGIIDQARKRQPGLRILLAGMQMPGNMGRDYTEAFREIFPAVAKAKDVELIPFLLEGVGAQAEFNQADMIHPNAAGHRRVADNVWPALKRVLGT